jgi:hypothetical protein
MTIAPWFRSVLLVWALVVPPVLFLAYGFSEDSLSPLDVSGLGVVAAIAQLLGWAAVIFPVFVLPFAVKRSRSEPQDGDRDTTSAHEMDSR